MSVQVAKVSSQKYRWGFLVSSWPRAVLKMRKMKPSDAYYKAAAVSLGLEQNYSGSARVGGPAILERRDLIIPLLIRWASTWESRKTMP